MGLENKFNEIKKDHLNSISFYKYYISPAIYYFGLTSLIAMGIDLAYRSDCAHEFKDINYLFQNAILPASIYVSFRLLEFKGELKQNKLLEFNGYAEIIKALALIAGYQIMR